jgi:hypothetical protein
MVATPTRLVPLLLAGLPVLALPYTAQFHLPSAPPQLPFGPPIDLAAWERTWPEGSAMEGLGRGVVGDFTGDLTPDLWQQTARALVLFMDHSYMDYSVEFPVQATAIACYTKQAGGSRDRLAYTDDSGVHLLDFRVDLPDPWVSSSLGFPHWKQARSLDCWDLDQDGDLDLLAVSADGSKLYRLLGDSHGAFVQAPDILLGIGATQAFALDYLPGQPPCVAVLNQGWFFVVRSDGVRTKVLANPGPNSRIARVRQAPAYGVPQPDCVAWLRDSVGGGGAQELVVVDYLPASPPELQFLGIDAAAIFSGDHDGDGSDDVGLLSRHEQVVHLIRNQRDQDHLTEPRFAGAALEPVVFGDAGLAGVENTSVPALQDANFDLRADLFVVDPNLPRALAITTEPPPSPPPPPPGSGGLMLPGPDSMHPAFHRGDFFSASYFEAAVPGVNQGLLMLSLQNAWGLDPDNLPVGWRIELVAYRQAPAPALVEPQAVVHHEYDLSGGSQNVYRQAAGAGAVWALPIEIDDAATLFDSKYYIVLRVMPPGDSLALTEYLVGFTSEEADGTGAYHGSMIYLVGLPGAWNVSIPYDLHENPPGTPTNSRQETGGAVPLLKVPRYSPGTPHPGPITPPPAPVPLTGN